MADREDFIERQRALAQFGELALRCEDLQVILTEGCRLIADALGVDLAKVIEIEHDGDRGFVRAGVGWNDGIVGSTRLPLNENTSEAFAIKTSEPVITRDIAEEVRFVFPPFMKEHGVVALVNVPILLPEGEPYGLLQVDSRVARDFGEEEIEFLRTYATVLASVVNRLRQTGELRHAAERFRLIVESARDYAIFVTDPDDVVTDWMPGAAAIFGWGADEIVGRPAAVIFTPEDRANGVPAQQVDEATREGKAPNVRWHVRKDGTPVFIEGQTIALRYPDGRIRGFMKIGQDVTERRRDEERQAMLLNELQHRVRNVLATVRSMVRRAGDHGTVADFKAVLDGRLAAMARTQALLTRAPGRGVDLHGLVRDELAAQAAAEGRVGVSGPPVVLSAKAAEILTLAVHELATNAIEHGALARPAGRVTISWRIEPGRIEPATEPAWLRLTWQESGVEIDPDAPRRKGVGTELVTRRVAYELDGHGRIELEPDGVRCEIAFPLTSGESTLQTHAPEAFGDGSRTTEPRR